MAEAFAVVIINHQLNDQAIAMKQAFAPLLKTWLMDSGSDLSQAQRAQFDECYPNIYYSGLFNRAVEWAKAQQVERLLFIASDVTIDDYPHFVQRMQKAFSGNPSIGVYAPSTRGSNHRQMWPRKQKKPHSVCFAEGFCFASRVDLMDQVAPVDLDLNYIGWGLDVLLAYHAMQGGMISVVDSHNQVGHPMPSGYDSGQARIQRDRWLAQQSQSVKRFFWLCGQSLFKTRLGYPVFTLLQKVLC